MNDKNGGGDYDISWHGNELMTNSVVDELIHISGKTDHVRATNVDNN